MRKKIFIVLLVLISAIACVFGIAGCNKKPDSNGDNQDTNNEQGSDGHVHEYGSWTVTKEATCSEEGSHERTCTKCDYTQIETISKKGHTFNKDNICTVCEYELEYTTGLAYEEYTVRYNETYYIVTGMGTATDKDLVIPAYHAGKEVKKIAASAFSGKDALTSVYIANGIEQIGEKAFEYCTSIEKITLPESLNKLLSKYSNGTTGTFIGYYDNVGKSAFYGCQKLTDINLPDRGTIIGECAFEGTAYFKNVKNWDKGVLYIGNHLITTNENFTATSYTVSKDVVSIADKAFYGKSALKEFIISEAAYPRIGDNALKASGITKAEVSYYHGENQLKYLPASNITDLTVHGNIYEGTLSNFVNVKTLAIDYGNERGCLKGLSKLESFSIKSLSNWVLGELFGETAYEGSLAVERGELDYMNRPIVFYLPANLKNVTVLSENIHEFAFINCTMLESITLGKDITKVKNNAFDNCIGLKSVKYLGDIAGWCSIEFSKGKTGTESQYYSSNPLHYAQNLYMDDKLVTKITIPGDVKTICYYAFENCTSLTDVTISEGVERIISNAFNGCINLSKISLPNSLVSIGSDAFENCDSLISVTIPDKITSIYRVFMGCSGLTSVKIPDGVTDIGMAFWGCNNLKSLTIPDSVTKIGSYTFAGCSSLTDITIPNGVTHIDYDAFSGCSGLKSIIIPNNVTSIGRDAFEDCSSLTDITIPNGVTRISENTFKGCSNLTSITIPDSVTSIGESAFRECSGLTSIMIPDSVTSIGSVAFLGCSGLTSITIPNSVISMGYSVFSGCSKLTSITIPDSLTSIDRVFSGCTGLTSITIPNSVTSIGSGAFENCSGLTSVTIPNSVTNIGSSAFENCSGLTSITIPNSVTSIGKWSFYGCSGLTSITIPDGVKNIGEFSFAHCSGLTSISIPDGVTSIDYNAFSGCSGLTSVTIPNSVTNIGSSAFENCSELTSVTIGNGVTSICSSAFRKCSKLTSITIPNGITSIGDRAFSGCILTSVIIPDSVSNIGEYAFYNCSGPIYCIATEKPSGWDKNWNSSNCPVVWGYKGNADQ